MNLFNKAPKELEFKKIKLKNVEVWYMNNFTPLDNANSYFKKFTKTINWRQKEKKLTCDI